jgi:hypothetical protein
MFTLRLIDVQPDVDCRNAAITAEKSGLSAASFVTTACTKRGNGSPSGQE